MPSFESVFRVSGYFGDKTSAIGGRISRHHHDRPPARPLMTRRRAPARLSLRVLVFQTFEEKMLSPSKMSNAEF
jgi:hypothetical protein